MLERFSQYLATSEGSHAWLFLGSPREEIFSCALGHVAQHLGLTIAALTAHPDVHILRAPEEKTATGRQRAISIEDVRTILDRLGLTAFTGKKYVFIPDTDMLTDAAQHALLKSIEDPTGDVVACFFTEDVPRIIAPLRSRLFLLTTPPRTLSEWGGDASCSPEVFIGGGEVDRLRMLSSLVQKGKDDVDVVLQWLVVLQALAVREGRGSLFLAAVSAWEGIRAQGNVHAHLLRLVV